MFLWVGSALAAETACNEPRLATLEDEVRGLDAGQIVSTSAAALAEACRGWSVVLEAAGDIAAASPERRRSLDLAVAKHDSRWLGGCPGGERVLNEVVKMPRAEGRAHLWDGCKLDRLQAFDREEWVGVLDGLLILPIVAAVLLPEVGVDVEVSQTVVRGLAGLPPPPEEAKREPALPTKEELAAADEAERTAPKGQATPVPVAVPSTAEEPTDPTVVTVPPSFREGGQARVRWSAASLAAGGTCLARIRVGSNGQMLKITFLECPEVLQADVTLAAQQSKYRPALAGELPVAGAFRMRWTVGSE